MLDIFVAEIVLQSSGIVSIVRKFVSAGMAQHVRMDRERHLGGFPEALDKPMEADGAQRPATLRNKHVGVSRVLAP